MNDKLLPGIKKIIGNIIWRNKEQNFLLELAMRELFFPYGELEMYGVEMCKIFASSCSLFATKWCLPSVCTEKVMSFKQKILKQDSCCTNLYCDWCIEVEDLHYFFVVS